MAKYTLLFLSEIKQKTGKLGKNRHKTLKNFPKTLQRPGHPGDPGGPPGPELHVLGAPGQPQRPHGEVHPGGRATVPRLGVPLADVLDAAAQLPRRRRLQPGVLDHRRARVFPGNPNKLKKKEL